MVWPFERIKTRPKAGDIVYTGPRQGSVAFVMEDVNADGTAEQIANCAEEDEVALYCPEKKWPPKRWSKPPADFDVSMVMTTAKWSALWVKDEAEEEEHSAEDYPTPREWQLGELSWNLMSISDKVPFSAVTEDTRTAETWEQFGKRCTSAQAYSNIAEQFAWFRSKVLDVAIVPSRIAEKEKWIAEAQEAKTASKLWELLASFKAAIDYSKLDSLWDQDEQELGEEKLAALGVVDAEKLAQMEAEKRAAEEEAAPKRKRKGSEDDSSAESSEYQESDDGSEYGSDASDSEASGGGRGRRRGGKRGRNATKRQQRSGSAPRGRAPGGTAPPPQRGGPAPGGMRPGGMPHQMAPKPGQMAPGGPRPGMPGPAPGVYGIGGGAGATNAYFPFGAPGMNHPAAAAAAAVGFRPAPAIGLINTGLAGSFGGFQAQQAAALQAAVSNGFPGVKLPQQEPPK